MKRGSFRKVEFVMKKAEGYGNYIIEACYKGNEVKVLSHNSQAYDNLDSEDDKKYNEARKYCYQEIKQSAFNNF